MNDELKRTSKEAGFGLIEELQVLWHLPRSTEKSHGDPY
jgi:hypothetical protein